MHEPLPGAVGGDGSSAGVGELLAGLDEASVRVQVRRWVEATWHPELSLRSWRELLADSGWACPAWPRQWCGRSLPSGLASAATAELAAAGVPGPPEGVGVALVAPVLLEHGSDELKRRFIRATVTGEITWCQLFSEPGAGSDLAGLTTRAELAGHGPAGEALVGGALAGGALVGEALVSGALAGGALAGGALASGALASEAEWLVTGQKLWSTGAATADYGLLLARTDWDMPKHRGISCFVLPMRQPGVLVRPLRQMNGHSSFNEVFLDSARVPADHVIGEIGGGWPVAITTLAHERRLAVFPQPRGATGRAWQEAIAERAAAAEPHKWYPQRAGRPDLVIERARAMGKAADPAVRQEIARLITLSWSARWMAARAAQARAAGRSPGPEGSLGKLASSQIARQAARVHGLIAGASGMLTGPHADNQVIAEILVSVPAISIAGGTDEVQRTIIGERILGLPREPDVSKELPFRQVPRN